MTFYFLSLQLSHRENLQFLRDPSVQDLRKPQKRGRGFMGEDEGEEERQSEREVRNRCGGVTTLTSARVSILVPTSSEGRP